VLVPVAPTEIVGPEPLAHTVPPPAGCVVIGDVAVPCSDIAAAHPELTIETSDQNVIVSEPSAAVEVTVPGEE
jgi:hypothetical protein